LIDRGHPEFIFPPQAIPAMLGMRTGGWDGLVETVLHSRPSSPERAAFVLMMVRLAGCVSCQADSFRAMRGCVPCSRQAIRRFAGEEAELAQQYHTALEQVRIYLRSLES
jgi:hypothetical protein